MIRLLAVGALLWSGAAWGHAMWPASWHLVERADGGVSSRWEVPLRGGQPLPLSTALPERCRPVGAPWIAQDETTRRVEQDLDCGEEGLDGARIGVDGLASTQGDALVVIAHADGRTTSRMLRMETPSLVVPGPGAPAPAAAEYFPIGVEHIWTGFDHVLFVVGLVLVAGARAEVLLGTVTAFTLTHSVTLALSALGFLRFPRASVEAVIALSILLLAVEVTRDRERSWTVRFPWAVAGSCGLIHGLGFAGALASLGLPEGRIPLALLNFNLGVEAGQLVVVAASLAALLAARRLRVAVGVRQIAAYAMGSLSAFWFLQRAASIFTS